VVLSVGMLPGYDPEATFGLGTADDGFVELPAFNLSPAMTAQPGIFATGAATGPMDIVDSIMSAGAAAAEAAAYIRSQDRSQDRPAPAVPWMADRSVVHA
jgi:heterodisulfide reductase subunit A